MVALNDKVVGTSIKSFSPMAAISLVTQSLKTRLKELSIYDKDIMCIWNPSRSN